MKKKKKKNFSIFSNRGNFHRCDHGRSSSLRAGRLPVRQRGIRLLLQQAILGGAELGHHEFRQLRPGHVDRLPMRHPRGLDRSALQREWWWRRIDPWPVANILKHSSLPFPRSRTRWEARGSGFISSPWSYLGLSSLWIWFSVFCPGECIDSLARLKLFTPENPWIRKFRLFF